MLLTKKRIKTAFLRIILLLLAVMLLFSSCADIPAGKTDTVEIEDALGRRVNVPLAPMRTAALQGSLADVWLLSGGSLCAAASDAWEDLSLPLGDAVSVGGAHSPSLEAILASDPDLVIASAEVSAHVALEDALTRAGIAVLYFDIDCFEDYLSALKTMTQITKREDLYRQNGSLVQEKINEQKEIYQNSALAGQKILLLRVGAGKIKAKGSEGTVLGEMLADLGCVNIADTSDSLLENLGVEAVLAEEPYRIFVVSMGASADDAWNSLESMFAENPAWGALSAIKEGRVHLMDKTLFHLKPNVRWGEAYEILVQTLMGE